MTEQTVSIRTGWGGALGSGHAQRMACLADYLRREKGIRVVIAGGGAPAFLPDAPAGMFVKDILPGSACIIRDMRDSDSGEMQRLKAAGPVIAIDDCGPGRTLADAAIDLLPNLSYPSHAADSFIYGYNFAYSVRRLGSRRISKSIDIALYCGLDAPPGLVRFFTSLVPEGATAALLAGSGSRFISGGKDRPLGLSYAETLASARVILAHFGITLYEGLAAGCSPVSANPTHYHAALADRARPGTGIINLGIINEIDTERARAELSATLRSCAADSIDTSDIMQTIQSRLEAFFARLCPFLAS